MIIARRRTIGFLLYAAALTAATLGYRYSWHAGCLFDGKSGVGSLEAADPYLTASWWAILAALVLSVSAAPVGWARSRASAAGIAVVGLVLGAPLLFVVMWVAESGGVQACAP